MFDFYRRWFADQSPLRLALLAFSLLLIIAAPFAFAERALSGWRLMTTVIAPALVPPMFFVYPLDMTMCRVKMDGAEIDERARLSRAIKINVAQMLALLLAWTPFFWRLLDPAGFEGLFG